MWKIVLTSVISASNKDAGGSFIVLFNSLFCRCKNLKWKLVTWLVHMDRYYITIKIKKHWRRSRKHVTWNHSFSTYAQFSEKLTFLTLIRTRTCAYQGVRNVSFSENFAYLLNDLHLDLALLNHIFVYFLDSSHKKINLISVKSAVEATAYWAQ